MSGKEAKRPDYQRTDGEKKMKGVYGKKENRGRHWKTWGRELSEHPTLQE